MLIYDTKVEQYKHKKEMLKYVPESKITIDTKVINNLQQLEKE